MKTVALALLASFLVLGGCASVGRDFDETKVEQIRKGTTTRAEIEQWFGQPNDRAPVEQPNGGVLRYTYKYGKASWGGMSSSAKALVVEFDANDIVVDHAYSSQ